MSRAVIHIILLFLTVLPLCAQDNLFFKRLNSLTYEQYLQQDWKNLIVLGKEGIKRDIDYYYLRMRMGIAYFELGKYRQSVSHFQRALKFNDIDPVASEYLYYALQYSGRYAEAKALLMSMSQDLRLKIRPGNLPSFNSFQTGYQFSRNSNLYGISDFLDINDSTLTVSQLVPRVYNTFNLGLEHNAGKKMTLYHSYTYVNKLESYYSQGAAGSYFYNSRNINQHQYYLSGTLLAARGLTVTGILHLFYVNYPALSQQNQGSGGQFTISYPFHENQTLGSLSFQKEAGNWSVGITGSYLKTDLRKAFQQDFNLIYYPSGNLDLYFSSKFSLNNLYSIDSRREDTNFILNPSIGFKVTRWWWTEISATLGSLFYYADKQGYVVYNSPEIYKQQFGCSFIFPVQSKDFDLYLRYYYSRGSSAYLIPDEVIPAGHELDINIHTLNTGIKWKF